MLSWQYLAGVARVGGHREQMACVPYRETGKGAYQWAEYLKKKLLGTYIVRTPIVHSAQSIVHRLMSNSKYPRLPNLFSRIPCRFGPSTRVSRIPSKKKMASSHYQVRVHYLPIAVRYHVYEHQEVG